MATHSETRAALVASIEHWRENEAVTRIEDAKTKAKHCALCAWFQQFRAPEFEACAGCPVSRDTGHSYCQDSPWQAACNTRLGVIYNAAPLSTFTAAAKVEREFLEMLLAKFDAEHPAEAEDAAQ